MIQCRHLGTLCALVVPLLVHAPAHAVDAEGTANTVAAIPSDATAATVRQTSASIFRPAPMPGEEQASWSGNGGVDSDEGTLHPEILSMHQAGSAGGALTTASSDYDHEARMRPAGGMGLTIPMQ